jgi:hypothetical protein
MAIACLHLPHPLHRQPDQQYLVLHLVHLDSRRSALDQCLCLYGDGTHDLQLLACAQAVRHQGLAVWNVLRVVGRYVSRNIPPGLIKLLTMYSAFLVQAGGASIASGNNVPDKTILLGIHIYMGGVSFFEPFRSVSH